MRSRNGIEVVEKEEVSTLVIRDKVDKLQTDLKEVKDLLHHIIHLLNMRRSKNYRAVLVEEITKMVSELNESYK